MNLNLLRSSYNIKAQLYILSNILSYFLFIFFSLISLIVLLQIFRISDLILVNGGDIYKIYYILKLLIVLTLPILVPTTLLISLFLSYKLLREENELIAFASLGVSDIQLLTPSLVVCIAVTIFCYICNASLAPQAHIQSTLIENQIKSNLLINGIRPQIYYDHANFVIYAENKIQNEFINIYIKDKKENSITFAKKGRFVRDVENNWFINLELFDGQTLTNRKEDTKNIIKFSESKLSVPLNDKYTNVELFHLNQTTNQIIKEIKDNKKLSPKKIKYYSIEIIKRINLSLIPLVFWVVFVTFGFTIHNRNTKSSLFSIGIIVGISYFLSYFLFEAIAFANQNLFYLFVPITIYATFLITFIKLRKIFVY